MIAVTRHDFPEFIVDRIPELTVPVDTREMWPGAPDTMPRQSITIPRWSTIEDELERIESEILAVPGLSRYSMGPRLSRDGIPFPPTEVSGEAISVLITNARVRLGVVPMAPRTRWWQSLLLYVLIIIACVAVGVAWYYVML